jgi:site-specific DNA recombinase
MKSIAIYARVSTEQQVQQATIESQVTALKERVAADGHVLLPQDIYLDEGFSGSSLLRPALERLRDRIADGVIDRLYVHSPDRLARKYAYQVLLLDSSWSSIAATRTATPRFITRSPRRFSAGRPR